MKEIWKKIYRELGLDSHLGDQALKFAGTFFAEVRPNKVLGDEAAAKSLSAHAGEQVKTIISTANFLKDVVFKLVELQRDSRKKAITKVAHARFLAISIMLRNFDTETEKILLTEWEKVTFRIFTLAKKDTRFSVGDFVRLGYEIWDGELSVEEVKAGIAKIGAGFKLDEVINSDTWTKWYGPYSEEVRFLLFRYEEYLAAKNGLDFNSSEWTKVWAVDPARSIEHIIPQSSGLEFVDHLGNLTMLPPGVNSSLSDRLPKDKAARYIHCGMHATRSVGESIQSFESPRVYWRVKLSKDDPHGTEKISPEVHG